MDKTLFRPTKLFSFTLLLTCLLSSTQVSAGIIVDSITAHFSRTAYFKLNFDDTEYGPLPYGPADIQLSSVTSLEWLFPTKTGGTVQVNKADLQSGSYIGAYIDENGKVSITSFFLTFARGDLTNLNDYYLDINDSSMFLEFCPPFGCQYTSSDSWNILADTDYSSPYTVVSRTAPTAAVPEPPYLVLLGMGLLCLGAVRIYRRKMDSGLLTAQLQ